MKILTVLRGLIGLVTSNSRLLLLLILLNLCLSEARGKTIFVIYFVFGFLDFVFRFKDLSIIFVFFNWIKKIII